MKALLSLIESADAACTALEICARKGTKIVHQKHDIQLDEHIVRAGGFTHSKGLGGRCRVNLGATFGNSWRVEPATPREMGFHGVSVWLDGVDWSTPRLLVEELVTQQGGTIVRALDEADLVVFGGTLVETERARLGAGQERLVVEATLLQRLMPKRRAPPVTRVTGDAAKLWLMLSARSFDQVRQGLDLLASLGDTEIFQQLFADVTVDSWGELVRGKRFDGTATMQPLLDVALLGALSLAPPGTDGAALRGRVRKISTKTDVIPTLAGFDGLESLELILQKDCSADDLRCFGSLPALKWLRIASDAVTGFPPEERGLRSLDGLVAPALTTVRVNQTQVTGVEALAASPLLREVDLARNSRLADVDGLRCSVASLETVDLSLCPALASIETLDGAPRLRWLSVTDASNLTSIGALGRSPLLKWVELAGCSLLESLEGLQDKEFEAPPKHNEFSLANCASLRSLQQLPALPSAVSKLVLRGCRALEVFDGVERWPGIIEINATDSGIRDVSGLAPLAALERIVLQRTCIIDATPLGLLPKLTKVSLEDCVALELLPTSWKVELTEVTLMGCRKLTSLVGLRSSQQLLDLSRCDGLKRLDGLDGFSMLQAVCLPATIQDASALTGVAGLVKVSVDTGRATVFAPSIAQSLASVPKLRLDLTSDDLADLDALAQIQGLVGLRLSYRNSCVNLRFLCGLPLLESLHLGEKAQEWAGESDLLSRQKIAALQKRIAATHGLAPIDDIPVEAAPLSKEAAKRFRAIKSALVSCEQARVQEALATLAEAADGALYDAVVAGLDPARAFVSGGRPEDLGVTLKSVKVGQLPVARRALLALLSNAPDSAKLTVQLRAKVSAIDFLIADYDLRDGELLPAMRGFDSLEAFGLEVILTDGTVGPAQQTRIEDLRFLGAPPRLARLSLRTCNQLTSLDGVAACPIAELSLEYCSQLTSLDGVGACPLRHVRFEFCNRLRDLSALAGKSLRNDGAQEINYKLVGELESLSFLPSDAKMLSLHIGATTDLAPLARMSELRSLELMVGGDLLVLPTMPTLEHLSITHVDATLNQPWAWGRRAPAPPHLQLDIGEQPLLSKLQISHCNLDLTQLSRTQIRSLKLTSFSSSDLRGAQQLTSIEFDDCTIASLEGLQGSGISELALGCINGLTDVQALAAMPSLEELDLTLKWGKKTGQDVPVRADGLGGLPQVRMLAWHCFEGSLGFLAGWTSLKVLDMSDSGALTSLETLAALPKLETVYLRGAKTPRDAWSEQLQGKLDYVRLRPRSPSRE